MFVSVIICTYGRAAMLRQALESLLHPGNVARPGWELILVVQRETDELATGREDASVSIGRGFWRAFPNLLRVVVVEDIGKSNALNLAIAESRGDVLAMTDDDVVCAPDYIRAIQDLFRDTNVDGAQGRVLLDCAGGFPSWLDEGFSRFMSLRDFGDTPAEWNDNLSGTNMIVRAECIRRVGGFSVELGPGASGMCEDSEFSIRLRQGGCRLVYAPQILVRHQLSHKRLTKSFFRRRFFNYGASRAYYMPLESQLWRFGLYAAKNFVVQEARALRYFSLRREAEALHCQCHAREITGLWWQHCRFSHGVPRRLSQGSLSPSTTKSTGTG